MNNAFALVYAKPGSHDLRELIERRSTAALPLGGRYRVIDILLSNISNSGIRSVGLITQRNYNSLIDHIGSGKAWNLSKKDGGLRFLPPFDLATATEMYHGFADAILSKRDFIDQQRWPYCLLMGTDQIYSQDFDVMMQKHLESGADMTVMYSRDESLMSDNTGEVTYFELDGENVVDIVSMPTGGANCYANLRVCLMSKELLMRLVEDVCAEGRYDFDHDVLKLAISDYKVVGIEHKGYVGRITSVKSYFDVNQDMLNKNVRYELFNPALPVYTKTMDAPPTRFSASCEVGNSLFGNGCKVDGSVRNSVIFRGVKIAEGAHVDNCIVMQNTRIEAGAKLSNMIIDKNCIIREGARCISTPYDPSVVRKGTVVER